MSETFRKKAEAAGGFLLSELVEDMMPDTSDIVAELDAWLKHWTGQGVPKPWVEIDDHDKEAFTQSFQLIARARDEILAQRASNSYQL